MSLVITNNLSAIGINRNLNATNLSLATSLRNLSSGYKINTGSDDPAGLVISELLRAQNRGIERAITNTLEAQNVMGIAEGALVEVNAMLKKMKQLAIHANNSGVVSAEQVAADQAEIDSSIQTIDRIARTTTYSGENLLNGSKKLTAESSILINTPKNFALLDQAFSEIYQVKAGGDARVSLTFSGGDKKGDATMINQAMRAYVELDTANNATNTAKDANGYYALTKDQSFTLQGNYGSRLFNFATGTMMGEMVSAINNVTEYTGVAASLIFNGNQTIDMLPYETIMTINDFGVLNDCIDGDVKVVDSLPILTNMIANIPAGGATGFYVTATLSGAPLARMANPEGKNAIEPFNLPVNDQYLTFELFNDSNVSIMRLPSIDLFAEPLGTTTKTITFNQAGTVNLSFNYTFYRPGFGTQLNTGRILDYTTAGVATINGTNNIDILQPQNIVTGLNVNPTVTPAANKLRFVETFINGNNAEFYLQELDLGTMLVTQLTMQAASLLGSVNGANSRAVDFSGLGYNIQFTYNYGSDGAGNYDGGDGMRLFVMLDDGTVNNDGARTLGQYTSIPMAPAPLTNTLPAVFDPSLINATNPWTVRAVPINAQTIRFEIVNTATNTVMDFIDQHIINDSTILVPVPAPVPAQTNADIAMRRFNISLASGGATFDFDYTFEFDPRGGGVYDGYLGDLARYNNAGAQTFLYNGSTDGHLVGNVTSPAPCRIPVAASQNIRANIDLRDVVNGLTPFRLEGVRVGGNQMTFNLHSAIADPAFPMIQTVTLPTLGQAGNGFIDINFTTAFGSTIDFRYWYENDPTTGEFDRPAGDLFIVNVTNVNSERIFNGLSLDAIANGAIIDINFNPATPNNLRNLEYGRNTDGQGRIYIKMISHDLATGAIKFELHKNLDFTASSLIGDGTGIADGVAAINIRELNNSNLAGEITFDDGRGGLLGIVNNFMDDAIFGQNLRCGYIAIGGLMGTNGVEYKGGVSNINNAKANSFSVEEMTFSGIALGQNTDMLGTVYFKTVMDGIGANTGQVFVYKDTRMRDEDLVARSEAGVDLSYNNQGKVPAESSEIVVNPLDYCSGLGIFFYVNNGMDFTGAAGTTYLGSARFTELGVRVAAENYGTSQFMAVTQNNNGQLWEQYSLLGDANDSKMINQQSGTVRLSGRDAMVTINGELKRCDGITLELANLDYSGKIVFNAGDVGAMTVAQVGYLAGSIFTNAKFLTDTYDGWTDANGDRQRDATEITTFKAGANLVNAANNTTQILRDFVGGMQLQLGYNDSNQNRTIIGISNMTADNIGKIRISSCLTNNYRHETIYALDDMMFGGAAALANNPIFAMKIVDQAINDVTNLRARLGAWQANLLQTNANSLEVAMENITKTESYIRDTDMAVCSTAFTRNQVLVQAGTSMLAQANNLSRNAMMLIE